MRISDWSSDVCSSDLLTISFQRSVRIARIGERLKFLSPVCDANTRSRKLSRSPVNTGRKLLPSIPCGLGAPAASSTVGKRSASELIASVAWPAGTRHGPEATDGTWISGTLRSEVHRVAKVSLSY